VAKVASRVPRRTNDSGTFDATTIPTEPQVVGYIDEVSALLNSILGSHGFDIPIDQADCVLILDHFVAGEVAAMVEGVNGSGRFGPTTKDKRVSKSRHQILLDDVTNFIEAHARGFEALGADRTRSTIDAIAFRRTDRSGDEIKPLFQREQFGNKPNNWDS